jgi:predicted Kef-type K+ transport protein
MPDLAEGCTLDQVVVLMRGLAAACTVVLVAAPTEGREVDSTAGRVAEHIQVLGAGCIVDLAADCTKGQEVACTLALAVECTPARMEIHI